jgi:excisionase family DNA binding protein
MDNLITIREASGLLGVSIKTLRRWEQQGKISSIRTPGGHRRYRRQDILQSVQSTPFIIGYARVNRPEQKQQQNEKIERTSFIINSLKTGVLRSINRSREITGKIDDISKALSAESRLLDKVYSEILMSKALDYSSNSIESATVYNEIVNTFQYIVGIDDEIKLLLPLNTPACPNLPVS